VNNVVDASNLVMLELGHPVHFFDLQRIDGATLRIRRAGPGSRLTTLDGVERRLDEEALVIADERDPVALAGVMGGAGSEIGSATRDVLIEAAWFDPVSIRTTSRKLGLRTDASHRFGRGADPDVVPAAQALALRLLSELSGGVPAPGLVDDYPSPTPPRTLSLRIGQLRRLLGYQPPDGETRQALSALGLFPTSSESGRVEVTIPSWRVDLEREADLVEEVARHLGYDRVPDATAGIPTTAGAPEPGGVEERTRDLLAHRGFHEAFGYAMTASGEDDPFVPAGGLPPLRLTNPIAESLAILRRSVLPGLIRAAALNHRRGVKDVRLFEVGRAFCATSMGQFPREPLRAALVWSGAARPLHWSGETRDVDLFDVMGVVEELLQRLGAPSLVRRKGAVPAFHPGSSATWVTEDGTQLAWCGALHPDLQRSLPHPLFGAELELESPVPRVPPIARYSPLPRLTAVTRDISLVLPAGTDYDRVRETLSAVEPPAPASIEPVDRYEGPPLGPGEVSVTVRITLSPGETTLTEDQIDGYRRSLIDLLQSRLGLRIRE
jgi:phenylalanyl-tRNA synthetase beta chain